MTIAAHDARLLELLKLELELHLPAALVDLAADGGPTLDEPASYEVVDDLDTVVVYPHCGVTLEGASEQSDWLTPQRDSLLPVRVGITFFPSCTDESTAITEARYYARAVDATLTRRATSIAGVWHCDVEAVGQEQAGEDRTRRRGFVSALLRYRTNRVVA